MRIVSDVRSGRRTVMPAAKWRRAATAGLAAATLMASGPVAAEDFYLRTGIGLDRSAETRFTDTDCASLSPAALYGCGPGPDGAPRSSLGDFGTRTGLGLGIGYAAAFSTRFEVLMEYHPRFAFEGHANFLESTRPPRAKVVRRSKVLAYETMRDIARRMWDKPPFLLGGAQAQHGAVGSEVLIRDIPGLSGIRPGNPILAGATSFARGSDQKERVACESCVQGTVCRNRFRSPSSPDGRVGLGVSRIRLALSHLVSHPKTFGRAHGPAARRRAGSLKRGCVATFKKR